LLLDVPTVTRTSPKEHEIMNEDSAATPVACATAGSVSVLCDVRPKTFCVDDLDEAAPVPLPAPVVRGETWKVHRALGGPSNRVVPEEVPVALVYNGTTHAVMMASPLDLDDFAVGFSLAEGLIAEADDIAEMSVIAHDRGIEIRMWLKPQAGRQFLLRRRALVGPTGCGLCGVESLESALPVMSRMAGGTVFDADEISRAVRDLAPAQTLNREVRALHAAAFWVRDAGLIAVREDVGRHNALDKLMGALRRGGRLPHDGIVVLTSRVSIELVQKCAMFGAPVLVAVSAPTGLAVRTAEACGMTLIGVARDDGFEVFTHPHRVRGAGMRGAGTCDAGLA
jgi:FdhD protein